MRYLYYDAFCGAKGSTNDKRRAEARRFENSFDPL
jgi:hypothetical protein